MAEAEGVPLAEDAGLRAEDLRGLISALRADLDALPSLTETAKDELVEAMLRHHGLLQPIPRQRRSG